MIRPFGKRQYESTSPKTNKRKKAKSQILTSTPVKRALEKELTGKKNRARQPWKNNKSKDLYPYDESDSDVDKDFDDFLDDS